MSKIYLLNEQKFDGVENLEDIIEKYEEKSIEIILVIKYTHKRRLLKIGKIFNKIKIYRILEHAKIHIKEELKNEQNISTK